MQVGKSQVVITLAIRERHNARKKGEGGLQDGGIGERARLEASAGRIRARRRRVCRDASDEILRCRRATSPSGAMPEKGPP